MAKKMTKDQALDKLAKEIGKVADAAEARLKANLPKLKASAKKLAEALKADESPDLVDTLAKHLKLQMRGVAEGTTLFDEVIRRLKAYEQDEAFFELVADEMAEGMAYAAKLLEPARKELAAAKKLLDQAGKTSAEHAKDAKQAAEEWAEAVAEVDRLSSSALKEIKLWEAWATSADEALAARDAKALARLQKARPAGAALDAVAEAGDEPFARFDAEFTADGLPEELAKEIARDRAAAAAPWSKATEAVVRRELLLARIGKASVTPRDAGKALKELGLPAAAKARLQEALDGPAANLGKSLEAIARAHKVDLKAADALARLKKAGI